jgi:hypothetical protein
LLHSKERAKYGAFFILCYVNDALRLLRMREFRIFVIQLTL